MAIYLKIDGIDGNVLDAEFEKWIACESINFGVSRDIQVRTGGGANREAHAAHVSEISLSKQMDASSPKLFTESTTGKSHKAVKIQLTQQSDGGTVKYMEYELDNCMVSGYDINGAMDMQPQENLRLSFSKIEMKFTPHDEKNKSQAPIPAGYDVSKASKV